MASAPKTKPSIELRIDGKDVPLSDVNFQSATTTAGYPTFVLMGGVGKETIFIRADFPKAEPREFEIREFRKFRKGEKSLASLNIDCRAQSGIPLLRPNGGTLHIHEINVDNRDVIVSLKMTFQGNMILSSGKKHEVALKINW